VKRRVDVVDRAWGEPAVELLAVQGANVVGGEAPELEASKGWLDVYPNDGLVPLVCALTYRVANAVRKPAIQVLP